MEIATPFVHATRVSDEGETLMDQRYVSFEVFIDTAVVLRALGPSASG